MARFTRQQLDQWLAALIAKAAGHSLDDPDIAVELAAFQRAEAQS
jgi:hypothetical protein